MKEYCIYVVKGRGCPYTIGNYRSFSEAKQSLMNMLVEFETRKRIFYVDNDFFENKNPPGLPDLFYYQIQEREVTEWKKYGENEKEKSNLKQKCKIIKFHK